MTEYTRRPPAPAPPASLRDRHKQRTLQALREAGIRLFLEQGFDATTIDQIVEEANVSQRTFFRYFPCKEALLFGLEYRDHLLAELRARPIDEPLAESLRAAIVATWPMSLDTAHARRSLRQRLIATHPAVRTYSLQITAETAQKVAEVTADRLGIDIASDPRPHVYGQLWAALNHWLLQQGDLGIDPSAAIDQFFDTAHSLLIRGADPHFVTLKPGVSTP